MADLGAAPRCCGGHGFFLRQLAALDSALAPHQLVPAAVAGQGWQCGQRQGKCCHCAIAARPMSPAAALAGSGILVGVASVRAACHALPRPRQHTPGQQVPVIGRSLFGPFSDRGDDRFRAASGTGVTSGPGITNKIRDNRALCSLTSSRESASGAPSQFPQHLSCGKTRPGISTSTANSRKVQQPG